MVTFLGDDAYNYTLDIESAVQRGAGYNHHINAGLYYIDLNWGNSHYTESIGFRALVMIRGILISHPSLMMR